MTDRELKELIELKTRSLSTSKKIVEFIKKLNDKSI
jgi:hypothetical protein